MDYYNRRSNFNRPIPVMCKYFKYGDCFNGDNCNYMHAGLCRDDGRCKDDNCTKSHVKQRDPSTYLKNVRRFQPSHFRRSPMRRSRSRSRSSRSSYGSPGRRSKSPSFSPKKISRRRSRSKSEYGYQKRSSSPQYISSKRISTSPFFNPMKEKVKSPYGNKRRSRSHSFSPVPPRRKHSASPVSLRRKQSASPPPSRKKHSASPVTNRKKRSVSSVSSGSTSSSSSSSSGSIMIAKSKTLSEKSKKKKVVASHGKKVKDSQTQNGSAIDEREDNSRDVLIIKQESPADLYDCLEEKPSPITRKDVSGFKPVGDVFPTKTIGDSNKDLVQMLSAETDYSPSTRALHILKNLPKDFFDAPKVPVKESSDTDQEAFREAFLKALSSTELASSSYVTHSKEKTLPTMMRHPLNAESLAKPFQDKLYGVETTNVEAWTPSADRSKSKSSKHQGSKTMQIPALSQSVSNWEVDTPYVGRNKHGEANHATVSASAPSAEGKMLPPPSKSKKHSLEPSKKKKKKHHRQISSSSSSSSSEDEDEKMGKDEELNKVVEIGDKEREEALEKKKDILSRVWTLMGQKKKLEMQRDEIALNHKGEGKSLPALLQENSILSTEIDKQIYIMNQMVQIINGRLGISKNETHMQDFYYQPKLFGDSELPPLFLKQYTTENLEKSVNLYLKAPEDSNKNISDTPPLSKRQKKVEKSKSRSRSRSKDRKRSKSAEHKSKKHYKEKKLKKDKSPTIESQKSSAKKDKKKEIKKESRKPSSAVNKAKSPTKVKSKTAGEVEYSPSPAMKPHIKYIDQGMHWCKICNDFQDTVPDYIKHLQAGSHIEKLKIDPQSWLPEPPKIDKEPIRPGAPVITIPLKGMEFTHSMTAFYCSLCDSFMRSKEEAEAHGETKIHVSKYKEYLSSNPMYETSYVKDKMAAYAKYSVEKERSRERASTLEDTNQEAFFCEVRKKIGVDLSSQNSISFEDDQYTSNDETLNNFEVIGEDKVRNDYICDDEVSKIDNEDNERKEIASELGSGNNIDEDIKNEEDWGEVLDGVLIDEAEEKNDQDDQNMNADYLCMAKKVYLGVEEKIYHGIELDDHGLKETEGQAMKENMSVNIVDQVNQGLEDKDSQGNEKKDSGLSMGEKDGDNTETRNFKDMEEISHEDNEEGKDVIEDEKKGILDGLSEILGGDHKEIESESKEEKEQVKEEKEQVKEELRDNLVQSRNGKDQKEERSVDEDLSDGRKNEDEEIDSRKAKKDRKEEKRARRREKRERKSLREVQRDGGEEDTANKEACKKASNTASIRVSSRSLSSTNLTPHKESRGPSHDVRKIHPLKRADDFSYYKEKRLSVEEEEKIKALKERIRKKENMENEEPSDEEFDSSELDKQKKKLTNVMIGKMPFLKRTKSSSSNKRKDLIKADLKDNHLSVSAAEERIRKLVSEGINSNVQDSDEAKHDVESKTLPQSVHPNVEYITEIQTSGDESMFVKKIGPIALKEDKDRKNEDINIQTQENLLKETNLQNKEANIQRNEIVEPLISTSVQQNLPSKTFIEIPVPQVNNKPIPKNIEDVNISKANMSIHKLQQNPKPCSPTAASKPSFIPELKPPPAPFISVLSTVVPSNHIVLPDLRKPPPNMIQHNLATPPNQQRPMMQNNFPTTPNQQMMQHTLPPTPNQHMMQSNLPVPPSYHMMGPNLPVPSPSQHMMGHSLNTPPPNQNMMGHNLTTPPPNQNIMGHNLLVPPPNQPIMGLNLTVPPPSQNYSPINQQGRRMDFSMSTQNSSMVGTTNSNFSMSAQNNPNSNYSMSAQNSPMVGPPNSNFSMPLQNSPIVGPPNSNFSMSQNTPMMGQNRPTSDFSMSPQNSPIARPNNSMAFSEMMGQNYQTRSNSQMLGSSLPMPPTPPEISVKPTNYKESSILLKPPPPPFNFSPLAPTLKTPSYNNESGRNLSANNVSNAPNSSSLGNEVSSDSSQSVLELNNPEKTLTITPSMKSCLDNFFETILDDLPENTSNKKVPVKPLNKVVPVKPLNKVVPVKPLNKVVPGKPLNKVVPVKPLNKVVPVKPLNKVVPVKPLNKVVPVKPLNKVVKVKSSNSDARVKPLNNDAKVKSLIKDVKAKSLNKDITVKSLSKDVKLKSLNKDAKVKSLDKDAKVKSLNKDGPNKSSNTDVSMEPSNAEIPVESFNTDVPVECCKGDMPVESNNKSLQKDEETERADSLEEPDTLIQEGLELLEFAEETGISPKQNFNWDSSQDSI